MSNYLPTAIVAGKHSQRTGMLRHFVTRATDAALPTVTGPSAADAADGLLLFHFGDRDSIPAIDTDRPVIVGITGDAPTVLSAARYLPALQELPDHVDLDAVASHEVSERTAQVGTELATRVAEAFSPVAAAGTEVVHRAAADGARALVGDPSYERLVEAAGWEVRQR